MADFDIDAAVARVEAAGDAETEQQFEQEVGAGEDETGSKIGAVWGWTKRLPRNVSMGAYRAILNSVEATDELFQSGAELVVERTGGDVEPVAPLRTLFPGAFEAAHAFADEVEANNTVADDITQGIAQFAIPFTTYLKAVGGVDKTRKLLSLGRLALAEGVTAATAFEAHEARMADLVEMGRQMDNRFGEVLNRVSPDGSLANNYINWLTDRENEGEWEGRFKNAVDSLATTAGIASILKVAGSTLRASKNMVAQFGSVVPGTPRAQRGSIGATELFDQLERPPITTPGVKVTKAERKFFDEIWNSPADKAELLESVPGVHYQNGELFVPRESVSKLAEYVDETVRLEKGEGGRLPPSFHKGNLSERFGPQVEHAVEGAEHKISIPEVGEAQLVENGKFLQQKRIDVLPEHRRTGAGMQIILRGIEEAQARGLTFASDVTLSQDAKRLYDGLKRRGFEVKENPNRINPNTGNLISEDPRVPIFEVTPKE